MKRLIKFFVMLLVVMPAFGLFTGIEIHAANDPISGGVRRTIQFSGQNLYLDFGNQNDAIARPKSGASTQDVYFVYYPYKNAYKIYSADNPNLILAWNNYFYSTNVFFTNNGDLDEHYWVVESVPNSDKQYLRNYKKTDGYGYLGARLNQGYMNVSINSMNNYTNNYTELTISPQIPLEYPEVFTVGGRKEIVSLSTSQNIHIDSSYEAILSEPSFGSSQTFYLNYSEEKNAYRIINGLYDWTALGLENGTGDKVVASYSSATTNSDDQYWRIEYDVNGTFTLVNYKYPNKVLDIEYINEKGIYSVKISERTGSNTQKFKVQYR